MAPDARQMSPWTRFRIRLNQHSASTRRPTPWGRRLPR